MIQIDPKITQIQGFDENCLWFVFKVTQVKMNYQNTHPSLSTLEKWTGWEKRKVKKVAQLLVDLGLLSVENRFRPDGGQSSSNYKITTKFISFMQSMDGEEIEIDYSDKDEEKEPLPKRQGGEYQKGMGGEYQKGTHNTVNPIPLSSTTSVREQVENILFDEKLPHKQAIERLNLSEDEMNFLFDEVFIKNQGCTVDLLAQKVMSYSHYSKINYQKIQKAKENEDQRQKLAEARLKLEEQRIQEYHAKRTENINKIGTTDYSSNYKKPTQTFSGHIANLDLYQRDNENVTEFEARCISRENLGDVRIIKHYTKTKIVTGNDLKSKFEMAKKAMLEAKTVNY